MPDILPTSSVGKRPRRTWRIVLGVMLLLSAMNISASARTAHGMPEVVGNFISVILYLALAVWLIASGLPKTNGSVDFRRLRRRIWFKLAGIGFLVMIGLVIALWAISQFTASALVTWVYWFGWTWVSWLIADKRALRQFQQEAR